MKKIVLPSIILIVNLSCAPILQIELNKDPNVVKIFNREEIASLELIVNFFDSIILENTNKAQDIDKSYNQYFEALEKSESYEDLRAYIGHANSLAAKTLVKNLIDRGIFDEIWKFKYGIDLKANDTISLRLELNLQGKYLQLLKLLGNSNDYFWEYDKNLRNSGTISPINIAQLMKSFREVEFRKEVNRLVYAVHYITLLFDGEYK